MPDFVILTDSCCDMTDQMAQELGLCVLPLMFHLKEQDYRNYLDGREIPFHAFYEQVRSG